MSARDPLPCLRDLVGTIVLAIVLGVFCLIGLAATVNVLLPAVVAAVRGSHAAH